MAPGQAAALRRSLSPLPSAGPAACVRGRPAGPGPGPLRQRRSPGRGGPRRAGASSRPLCPAPPGESPLLGAGVGSSPGGTGPWVSPGPWPCQRPAMARPGPQSAGCPRRGEGAQPSAFPSTGRESKATAAGCPLLWGSAPPRGGQNLPESPPLLAGVTSPSPGQVPRPWSRGLWHAVLAGILGRGSWPGGSLLPLKCGHWGKGQGSGHHIPLRSGAKGPQLHHQHQPRHSLTWSWHLASAERSGTFPPRAGIMSVPKHFLVSPAGLFPALAPPSPSLVP